MTALRGLRAGIAGGLAGTTALNAVTYIDMAVRGRAASTTPEDTVDKLAARTGLSIPGDDTTRKHRLSGLGPLTGLLAGVGVGGAFGLATQSGYRPNLLTAGLVAGAAAMAATDAPMALLGVTDPRTWTITDWIGDAVPHLAYGLVTAAITRALVDG